ncbi:zinc-binding dehydrogenase, partial [Streptomonospora algeriensis]
VAVFGLGGVGLSALMGTNLAGAAQIIGLDPVEAKRELAARLGATDRLPGGAEAVEAVRELTGGGADKVIDTTGNADVLAQAYLAARPGGTTVTVGLAHPDRHVSIPAVTLAAQERTLRGSYLGSGVPARDIPAYISLYRRGMLPVTELLSGRLGLDELNEGFDRLASGEAVRQVVEL